VIIAIQLARQESYSHSGDTAVAFLRSEMSEAERKYVRAIRDKPSNLGLQMAYAEWLERQGEHEQAELTRVQVRLDGPFKLKRTATALRTREEELLAGEATLPVRELAEAAAATVDFEGGLPTTVCVTSETRLGSELVELFGDLPIDTLLVCDDKLDGVLKAVGLARARLSSIGWVQPRRRGRSGGGRRRAGARGLLSLVLCDCLAGVKRLHLRNCWVGVSQAKLLSRACFFSGLDALSITRCGLSAKALEQLLVQDNRRLTILDLEDNPLGDAGAITLTRAALRLQRLYFLGLARTNLGPSGAQHLAGCEGLPNLRIVSAAGNRLGAGRKVLNERFADDCIG
jgi:uncharacterized protein (TIGR02996 family)